MTDGTGIPLTVAVTAGQRHESTCFRAMVEATWLTMPPWPTSVAGDKGYSYPKIRRWLERRNIAAVIPRRIDQVAREGPMPFDSKTYRRRNVVERCIGWLKECRRVATRFDKLATSFLAMVKLAMIQRYLRVLASSAT